MWAFVGYCVRECVAQERSEAVSINTQEHRRGVKPLEDCN